jgi:hypothetical protein
MTRKITFRRQPPQHDLYWQAVAEHNSQFNNKTMINQTLRREAIIERGAQVALELYEEITEREYVGGEESVPFEFEGEHFTLTINASWGKATYFDYELINKEGEVVEEECCIDF